MADQLGIRDATQRLQTVLAQVTGLSAGSITLVPPDVTVTTDANGRVNLYLFRVQESASLRNQEIGTADNPWGSGRPPLSLEFSYLLTTHADNEETEVGELLAQELLGRAMVGLHEHAIVALGTEKERLRISFEPASLDELVKLWSAMPQANYRRSVVVKVTVVQLKSETPPVVPRPVERRRVLVGLAQRRPKIGAAYHRPAGQPLTLRSPRIERGQTLTIEGENFRSSQTFVQLGPLVPIAVTPSSDGLIELAVPNAPGLEDGVLTVIVITQVSFEVTEGAFDRGTTLAAPELRPLVSEPAFVELVS
jgi:hypothetical protein